MTSDFALELHSGVLRQPIDPSHLGGVVLEPSGAFEAGSWQTFTLTYTAGRFGVDDTGALRICFRFASDQSAPQLDDPAAPNYTTVTASNGAILQVRFDPKGNVRPWDRTISIKVVQGFLSEGDRITVVLGDRSGGSPGMRLQTFCEDSFEFRVLADPIATFNFQTLPEQPTIAIVPGPPERFVAVLPTLRRAGEAFALRIKGEDRWGNPSDRCDATLALRPSRPVAGLPETLRLAPGAFAAAVEGLSVDTPGDLVVDLVDPGGETVARSNPLRIVAEAERVHFWGDLHGQSEETIGNNSADAYFAFARDRAFVDACGHQGNDFQITGAFWAELGRLTAAYDEPGRFVALPGYEWSGNTALGGDRNVYFPAEGRTIRRSSHALIEDRADLDTDCHTAAALFEALARDGEWDAVCFAHCGGRYADIRLAHDGRFERSVEVHSAWGTFEWLLHDALEKGYRVGVVANSDGHKGRPGASYPGAGAFGAIGGLTCYLMPELTRAALLACLRKRRHYGTTGGPGGRMIVDLRATFEAEGTLYHDDPALDWPSGPAQGRPAREATMGDIVHLPSGGATLHLDVRGAAPIERIDLFNGLDLVETVRPYGEADLGRRIRVVWEGATYRGRARQLVWDGEAQLTGNRFRSVRPLNFLNRDKTLDRSGEDGLAWRSLTTGNFAGFDAWLEDSKEGRLAIRTPVAGCDLAVSEIGLEDRVYEAPGPLPRRLRLFRLPDENPHLGVTLERPVALHEGRDNALYVRITQEDGTLAWTSPIYVFR